MDSGDAIRLCILAILLFLSAFFSSAETALMTVNKIKIMALAEGDDLKKQKRANTVLKILDQQETMLSAILIGNNIVNLSASSLATLLATKIIGNAGAGIATGILTLCVLVFGEISPKNIASVYSEGYSMRICRIIYALMTILTPVIFVVNLLVKGFMFILRINLSQQGEMYTEDELRVIVDVSHEEGVLEHEEREMITNVFDFDESKAKDIMVSSMDLQMLDVNATYEEVIESIRENMFTRYPVYEDDRDNIIGIFNIKDIFMLGRPEETKDFRLRDYIREAHFTHEFKNTSDLFRDMKRESIPMVIVRDEFGAVAGLVTLEDLIEEIVGEIRDEYDADELDEIKQLSEREWSVEAAVSLDDLNDRLELKELKLESEEYDSVGGLMIGLLDRWPEEGDTVTDEGIQFTVEKMDKNRIERIHLLLPEHTDEEDAKEEQEA